MASSIKLLSKMIIIAGMFFCFGSYATAECIGVVTAGGGQGFWGDVIKGANQAGKELGIEIHARGAVDEANVEGQRYIIESTMKFGCKGLVLAPNSKDRKKDVAQLKAQGIPTVFIDRDIGGDRISIIKTENFSAGEKAGIEMAKALGGKGKIAILRFNEDVASTTARENGFIKGASSGGLEIVVDQYIGTMVGEARSEAYRILKISKRIDGIFTPNESTSLGVIKALERLNKAGKVVHIGFDAHRIMIESIKSKHIYGFIVQRPFQMGYQGVHTVYRAIHGKDIKQKVNTDVVFIGRENINQTEIRKILGLQD
ncbi:MAG: substrate-binding domain-containing protein [Deltaproteobacteria bacterium]|nr:substrate-binding domain-containing protein [Deltaproteobacteria bacterium]